MRFNYYNKWETEEDYNDYVSQTEENQRLLKYDIEGAKAEKAELESMNEWWAKEMSEVDAEVDSMFEESFNSLMDSTKKKRKMTQIIHSKMNYSSI